MSLDMFVFAIPDEEKHRFPREIVERAFAAITQDVKDEEYRLMKDGEEAWARMSLASGELIDAIAINRPPSYNGFPEFWGAIFDVLRQTPTRCIVQGVGADAKFCIANPAVLDELPADFAEEYGEVRFVSSAA